MDFREVVGRRYACKKYDGRAVDREILERILEAGRLAPTAKNLQEQHIYVLMSDESLSKVDKVTPCRYGCRTVLLIAYDSENVYTYPRSKRTSGTEDAAIVATHLCLAAANENVDSCIVNNFDAEEAKREFALPENEEILMLLDLGYAAEGAGPLANHFSRKPLSETVTWR